MRQSRVCIYMCVCVSEDDDSRAAVGQLCVFIKGGEEVFVFREGSSHSLHRRTDICVKQIRRHRVRKITPEFETEQDVELNTVRKSIQAPARD